MTYNYSRPLGEMDPNILLADVAFNKHIYNDGHHVSPYNEGRIDVGLDNLEVRLVQGIDEESFKRTLSKAQRATIGIPTQDDDDIGDWEEMLKGGLQTALESQTVIFEVYGVARATTHQLVRSRRAAFHQQSMRASYFGEQPNFRMPESVWRNEKAREAWENAIKAAHQAYSLACSEGVSYQDARFILPIGTETYIMCEYPVREFLAVYAYRACSMFQWEICHTVRQMGSLLAQAHPWLAPYIKISCEGPKKCTFQGWEDVEKGCDFPWAHWEDRVYKPEAHRIRTTSLPLTVVQK
jgi:thymidylate synthase (FAD)